MAALSFYQAELAALRRYCTLSIALGPARRPLPVNMPQFACVFRAAAAAAGGAAVICTARAQHEE